MTLREELERRVGKLDDRLYRRLLDMALDDLRQYDVLTPLQTAILVNGEQYPPNDSTHVWLAQTRQRLLDAMVVLWDILRRRGMLDGSPLRNPPPPG